MSLGSAMTFMKERTKSTHGIGIMRCHPVIVWGHPTVAGDRKLVSPDRTAAVQQDVVVYNEDEANQCCHCGCPGAHHLPRGWPALVAKVASSIDPSPSPVGLDTPYMYR